MALAVAGADERRAAYRIGVGGDVEHVGIVGIEGGEARIVVLPGIEPRAGVGDLVHPPRRAVPAGVIEPVVEASLAARQAAAVFLHREDHVRPLGSVQLQVAHPGHVVGIALKHLCQVPRVYVRLGRLAKLGTARPVREVDGAVTDERVIKTVVVVPRVIFGHHEVNRPHAVEGVLQIGAVSVGGPVGHATAVVPGAPGVVGMHVIRLEPDAAEKVHDAAR